MKHIKSIHLSFAFLLSASLNLDASISLQGSTFSSKVSNFYGDLNMEDCSFGGLILEGNLQSKKSTFKNDITVNGNIILEDCSTKNIIVKSTKEDVSCLIIGNTKVEGNITFEKKGKVIITEKAKINGKVENGEIIKISTKELEKYLPKK